MSDSEHVNTIVVHLVDDQIRKLWQKAPADIRLQSNCLEFREALRETFDFEKMTRHNIREASALA